MPGVAALQLADDTLKNVAVAGLVESGLTPRPDVTVGPLDREAEGPRLNWFLYRVAPHAGYRNMEPPRTGSRTARGTPPLALELHYLLTAYPAEPTSTGDQEQIAHTALAAAMRALHDNAIVGDGSALLPTIPAGAPELVEPVRIAMENLDLETLSKVWTAASQPLRLSVGYVVSLVLVESLRSHDPGPPVLETRAVVVPSLGPRVRSVDPVRFGGDLPVDLGVDGMVAGTAFTLAAEDGDPAGAPAGGWPMTVVEPAPPGLVRLSLPRHDLAPGARRLDATATVEGLPFAGDRVGVTVVPVVRAHAPATPAVGGSVTLTTSHATPDVEVFVDGRRAAVTAASATSVTFTVPAGSAGRRLLSLRANRVAGPGYPVQVAP